MCDPGRSEQLKHHFEQLSQAQKEDDNVGH